MTAETLLLALGDVKDEYIETAYFPERQKVLRVPLAKKALFFAAAALTVATILAAQLINGAFIGGGGPGDAALPVLQINTEEAGSYGFEGYSLRDPNELVNENPWTEENDLDTLPVFDNTRAYLMNEYATTDDIKEMEAVLREVAHRLDIDVRSEDIKYVEVEEEQQADMLEYWEQMTRDSFAGNQTFVYWVTLENEELEIQVNKGLNVMIFYKDPAPLPDDLNFTYDASYEELKEVGAYLLQTHGTFLGMDEPRVEVHGGDYGILEDGTQQRYQLRFFDGAGSLEEQIVGYNFHTVRVSPNEQGRLWIIDIQNEDIAHTIGDYPIVSADEAEKMLREGHYVTSVPEPIAEDAQVVKREMVYRTGRNLEVYLPYYRFIVALPINPEAVENHGLKTYGAYYVPAVEPAYIQNMPVWENNFNS